MLNTMHEKRPLKRPRLGPPDVYPQEARQKEDELTSMNVKHGFATMPQLTEEFGTARNCNVTASKVGAYFNAILARREELMTLPDSGRKKQQINPKDNFWPVTVRSKQMLDIWFRDLASNKPLISLAKKAPSFNKKEEIFTYLCDYQVSFQKAAWFIKLSSAYTVAVSEAKIKKRQMPDPATEWTGTIIKFMKDLLPKLQEHFSQQQGSSPSSLSSSLSSSSSGLDKSTTNPQASSQNSTFNSSSGGTISTSTNTVPPPLTSPASLINSPANATSTPSTGSTGSLNATGAANTLISGTNTNSVSSQDDYRIALKQWTYCVQLSKYMYDESLLDRQEFLNWILELLDRMRSHPSDDGLLRIFLPLAMQYMNDFIQTERLSRRLAYLVCKKLTYMLNNAADSKDSPSLGIVGSTDGSMKPEKMECDVPLTSDGNDGYPIKKPVSQNDPAQHPSTPLPPNPFQRIISDYMICPHHRDMILELSAILHVITLECATALVWCGLGENRVSSALVGSPLDHLPIAPSDLPMPSKYCASNEELRGKLKNAEENIKKRSRHAEARWCADKWQNKNGNSNAKILATLDALDNHCFDRLDTNNSNNLDVLYAKIFPPVVNSTVSTTVSTVTTGTPSGMKTEPNAVKLSLSPSLVGIAAGITTTGSGTNNTADIKEKRVEYSPTQDAPIVQILCEWAVSWQRWGEHRAMAVAWLLDKRQSEVTMSESDSSQSDDKESIGSGNGNTYGGVPIFQNILMHFLDHDSPVLEENGSQQNRSQFTNLVHLFSELIRHDVFSHDAYMCTLISRGDLLTGNGIGLGGGCGMNGGNSGGGINRTVSNKPSPSNQNHQVLDDDMFQGIDFKPKMEEEFDDSNVDDDLDKILQNIKEDQQNALEAPDSPKDSDHHGHSSNICHGISSEPLVSRHFLYAKHFPLSQDDPVSQHDCNQRYVLLFGVGKERDEKKHAVKKMAKEICKLFSKKFSIDVAEGGKVKKHSRSEFNFESTTNKCQSMSYFDQHVVNWQCAVTVQEMLNSFAMGNSNYLPVQEHVAFLFDLMEMALNIYGLIDMCIQILKELPEVEAQLMIKNTNQNSNLVKSYTTSLSLYVVGVLRRYHCCLLLSPDQTSAVFEGLCKVVKHVTNPGDCSSAERCILAYLYDLYTSCSLLKTKPQSTEPFHNAHPKIKQALYAPVQPVATAYSFNSLFMVDVFTNPKRGGKIEQQWGRQLNESGSNRYSFVCNALIFVSKEQDNDRLNDIAATCAELTACCNALSAEWLGALIALCGSSNETFYTDILGQIDIHNISIHNSLAVFTCILVARRCFSLENFVFYVALPPLVTCNGGREITPEAESGARLSCHLLLRLFKTIEIPQPGLYSVSTSPNPITSNGLAACNIKLSCDRHLLAAAHKNIAVAPVLAVLKAILVVGDATYHHKPPSSYSGGKRSGLNTPVHPGSTPKSTQGDLSHILGTSDLGIPSPTSQVLDITYSYNNVQNEYSSSLSDFAQHVLRQICSQEWVLERCLQNADELCKAGMLIDPMLTSKQAQRLLHMICYPENESNIKADMDQRSIIVRILENLEQWSLRISWLDLQLMYKQTKDNSPELSNWLDMVARAAIDVFQSDPNNKQKTKSSIWLVAPLVSKLPDYVQGRILQVTGHALETTNFFTATKKSNSDENNEDSNDSHDEAEKAGKASAQRPQLSHQAFLGLILTCLKGQDEQKEGLLSSLHSQLSQFLRYIDRIEDSQGRERILDALQLRFSLVGGMFDAIQKNGSLTTDWAILLSQLISQGVIDLSSNSELFTTVLDMLTTLIHSTLISDSQSDRDENKKIYINLMKKLKKELGDKTNASVKFVRQLLPLSKLTCEVIACESAGCLTDTKGNKIAGFDSIDKKPGLRLSDKQRVSVWDLLEGHKNPAPLSWAWFGAVKMERRPLAYEETHRLLKYHTHSLVKPSSYFYEPLPLPPEDLEPLPEKPPKDDLKADTPSSVDQSPSSTILGTGSNSVGSVGGGRGRGKGTKRAKKSKAGTPVPIAQQQQPQQQTQQQHPSMPNQMQSNNPLGQMQMTQMGPNHMNPNMQQQQQQQFNQHGNQMQNANPMLTAQMQQNVSGGAGMGMQMNVQQNQSQQMGMGGFIPGSGNQMMSGGQQSQNPQQQLQQQQLQQQSQHQWGYNQSQQQHPQQQFYNQGMGHQMNRFDRPQINNQSKQALSIMLRQRHPFIGNNQPNAPFNIQQQRQQVASVQQQQQQQQFMRNQIRGLSQGQQQQIGSNQMGGTGIPGQSMSTGPAGMGQLGQSMGAVGGGGVGGGNGGTGPALSGMGGGQINSNTMMSNQAAGGPGNGPGTGVGGQMSVIGQNPMSGNGGGSGGGSMAQSSMMGTQSSQSNTMISNSASSSAAMMSGGASGGTAGGGSGMGTGGMMASNVGQQSTMMGQQNAGILGTNMNQTGQSAMVSGPTPNSMQSGGGGGGAPGMGGVSSNMFGSGPQQFGPGGMGQNFGGYGAQGMAQQSNIGGGSGNAGVGHQGMGNFNQMGQQRNSAEYMAAQQRSLQQQQVGGVANRNQFMQQVPNVTMNNMVGQGAAPPYPRQGPQNIGKPGVGSGGITVAQTQQQQQYQQQQHRIRQQILMQQQQQQQQGMGGQGNQMPQNPNQGMVSQQTPALVAQLQRQLPNQQGMMGQQYSHQPPQY